MTPVPTHPALGSEQQYPPPTMAGLSPPAVDRASLSTSGSVDQAQSGAHNQYPDSAPTRAGSGHATFTKAKPTVSPKHPRTNWPGLGLLQKTLDVTTEALSPLKDTINSFTDLVEVFEIASTEQSGDSDLRTTLDTLLADISQHVSGMATPKMTASMENLRTAINTELQTVKQSLTGDSLKRRIGTINDSNQALECYQRLRGHLERFSLNANMSVWQTVDEIAREARLHRLSTALSAMYNSFRSGDIHRGACTEGTRQEELAMLLDWARSEQGAQVCWVSGLAGTGKTTIAYSLCAILETTGELGASFFCSRQIPECRDVQLILPAIAYQLARFSLPFCCELMKVLEADPDVHNRALRIQFEFLLVNPLVAVKHTLPGNVIVVVDALDECENENSIGQILDTLLSQSWTSDLPVRFLVSSRPEPQIYTRMAAKVGTSRETRLVLHELDKTKVERDIETYLQTELADFGFTSSQLRALAAHAGGLFIYASTAVRYIKGGLDYKQHEARLKMILGLMPPSKKAKEQAISTSTLYRLILESAFGNQSLDEPNSMLIKTILDTVICAQEPLTVAGLAGMLGVQDLDQIEGLLGPLRPVLNVGEASRLVTTMHSSFPEFMRDQTRASVFSCDSSNAHFQIAQACLKMIAANDPQFNICNLGSSHLSDGEIPDLAERTDCAISEQLFYACRYWMTHVELGGEHDGLYELINQFLSEQLLLWMEVLNLKKCMQLGPRITRHAESWLRTHKCPKGMKDLAHDAWRFVTAFASHAVSRSTPHIYVSMLPFWPESAPITKSYTNKIQGAIKVDGSAMTRRQLALLATWSLSGSVRSVCFSPDESLLACAIGSSVFIIDGTTGRVVLGPLDHGDRVNDVAFSNDGAQLVSCSHDKTLKVWDTTTGRLALGPLTGHTDRVDCVSLFPDGKRIVSGSRDGTIRVWSLENGRTVLGPLKGQNRKVWSISVSSDGTRIASGHSGGKIRIWDAESGKMLLDPLSGHTSTVGSLSFSPDDTRLASGSSDNDMRLWRKLTGQLEVDVLSGHAGSVCSVAFSPDGLHIVSGSIDETIRLWDVEGEPQLIRVLIGHTNVVWSVRFSSDGARIVSSSGDRTIRVWDARTQAPAGTPLQGHTQPVRSVAFSPDATRILSGSNDGTIYIWDAHTGQIAIGPMKGHTDWVNSVCFSPEQSRIASTSEDKSVRLWDAYSGQAVGKPLAGHSGKVVSVCFSPNGGLVASCSEDKTIRLWDAQSGEVVGSPLMAHTNWVCSVCFSPDGLHIVSGSADKTVIVWDVNTRQSALPPLKGHTDPVWAVCVSPDGSLIASGSVDNSVRLWNAHSGQNVFDPLLGHSAGVESVSFSRDGSYVVSGSWDKTARLWDARSGQAVGSPLIGHTDLVHSVAFSPNGRQIVSGSWDLSIRVWDVANLVQVKESQGDDGNDSKLSHGRESWVMQDNGWVVDSESRLLAWVPPDLHASLMNPRNPLLISTKGAVQLDLELERLGESWTECYKPRSVV